MRLGGRTLVKRSRPGIRRVVIVLARFRIFDGPWSKIENSDEHEEKVVDPPGIIPGLAPFPTEPFACLPPRKKVNCHRSDNDCGRRYKKRLESKVLGSIKPNENPSSQTVRWNAANLRQAYRNMKIGFIEQEKRRERRESKFKTHPSTGDMTRRAFIWLPFAGGVSAFAVILPKPRE
jgi:hypothetical protein